MQVVQKQSDSGEFPPSVHVYCRSAALCAGVAIDRSNRRTVVLEFARKGEGRSFDWNNKIAFQLSQGELAELAAYLRHPWASHKWVHRPNGVVKGLEVSNQSPNILFELSTASARWRVPVIPRDQYYVRNLLLSRLFEIQSTMPTTAHYDSLAQLAEALKRK